MFDYYGYSLDSKSRSELSSDELNLLDACIWMIENKSSLRDTAKNWDFSKSYLHNHIHNDVSSLSPDMYVSVKKRLKINFSHRCKGKVS